MESVKLDFTTEITKEAFADCISINGERVDSGRISVIEDGKTLAIAPPPEGFEAHSNYTLYIDAQNASDLWGENIAIPYLSMSFSVTGWDCSAVALQKKDINFTKNCINVYKTLATDEEYKTIVQHQTKTVAGTRTIPMVESLKNFLINYTETLEKEDFLFLSNWGHLIQSGVFAYHWKCILKKINQYMPEGEVTNITPHYFRHNFTTDLVYAGVPLKTVQAIMGHEDIQTTMNIYADVRYNNDDVIDKLSSYLG